MQPCQGSEREAELRGDMEAGVEGGGTRSAILDNWRAGSILLVLSAHLLPLGPKALQLNHVAGAMGMALFFILSGYLITSNLLRDANISAFLIRRFTRILPLAWLYLAAVLLLWPQPTGTWIRNLLFVANWPPMHLTEGAGHFWSLCVELQFYVCAALLVVFFSKRWALLLVACGLLVTGFRVANGVHIAVNTYFRVDEILAGSMLALARQHSPSALRFFSGWRARALLLIALAAACHPAGGPMNYLRPYLAMLLVGGTLTLGPNPRAAWMRALGYVAAISYALYVLHPLLAASWLGAGGTVEKYLKRPLLFAVLFALAHVSTFHFEKHWIEMGRRWARRRTRHLVATQPPQATAMD